MLHRFPSSVVRRRVILGIVGALGAAAAMTVAACSVATSQKEARPSSESSGPVSLVLDAAIDAGDLSDDQRAEVDAIRERTELTREDRKAMRSDLRASFVGVVRAGSADSEQFDRAVDRAATAMQQRVHVGCAALKDLHALLEPEQRGLVAEELRRRVAERRKERADAEARPSLGKAAARLMLDTTQLSALQGMADDWRSKHKQVRPSEEEVDALIDAFEDDDFADVLDEFASEKLAIAHEHLANAGSTVDGALSILSPEQRSLLAQWIEEPQSGPSEPAR